LEFIDNMKLKLAIIVRTDLGMGKGKIAGQVAHAAVQAAESIRRYCPCSILEQKLSTMFYFRTKAIKIFSCYNESITSNKADLTTTKFV
jgi:hypothetical protein